MHKVCCKMADEYHRMTVDDLLQMTGYSVVQEPHAAELVILDDALKHRVIDTLLQERSIEKGLRNAKLEMALGIYRVAKDVNDLRKSGYKGKICVFTASMLPPEFMQERLSLLGADYVIELPDHMASFLRDKLPMMFSDYGSMH